MKNILFLLLTLTALSLRAQDVPLGVYPMRNPGNLTADQTAALRSKIVGLVANAGYASADGAAPVGVLPELVQYEPRTVEAGMRNVTVMEVELVLNVQQRDGQVVFGSKRKKLTVSGKDMQQVKSQMVNAIPASDAMLQAFLQEMKVKVDEYYQKNCNTLLADATRKTTTDQFAEALSTLINIPANAPCRAEADGQLAKVYDQYRETICRRQLLNAKSATAAKKYDAAVAALRNIDPRSTCYADAQDVVKNLQTQANADFKATLDGLVEYWKAQSSLDQRRYEIVHGFLKDIF